VSTKFKEFLRFLSPGERERARGYDVSYNGTSTVSPKVLEEAVFKHFEEMNEAGKRAASAAGSDHS